MSRRTEYLNDEPLANIYKTSRSNPKASCLSLLTVGHTELAAYIRIDSSRLAVMSAFNDFCIVCDQLIPQQSLPPRVDKLLYCSEQCMVRDTSRVPPAAAPAELSESASSLGDVDSLIASPLLLPVDGVVPSPKSSIEENDYMLMELESASQAVPRTQTGKEPSSIGMNNAVRLSDRVAEDNYKLWLSQHS